MHILRAPLNQLLKKDVKWNWSVDCQKASDNNKLLYEDWVVIPAVLTKKILKDFYTGHPGISRMKALMRSYVYWYGMDKEKKL